MDLSNAASLIQQSVAQNNAWSAEQAQKQMDFQERMSNSAHVREIADLKAAGLNPVLSAKLGGASTPSGAMAQGDTSGTSALVDLLMMAMETANSAAGAAAAAAGSSPAGSLTSLDTQSAKGFLSAENATKGYKDAANEILGMSDKDYKNAMKELNPLVKPLKKLANKYPVLGGAVNNVIDFTLVNPTTAKKIAATNIYEVGAQTEANIAQANAVVNAWNWLKRKIKK